MWGFVNINKAGQDTGILRLVNERIGFWTLIFSAFRSVHPEANAGWYLTQKNEQKLAKENSVQGNSKQLLWEGKIQCMSID